MKGRAFGAVSTMLVALGGCAAGGNGSTDPYAFADGAAGAAGMFGVGAPSDPATPGLAGAGGSGGTFAPPPNDGMDPLVGIAGGGGTDQGVIDPGVGDPGVDPGGTDPGTADPGATTPDGPTRPILTGGTCCADGDCICRGDSAQTTSRGGPYAVATVASGLVGTIYYPTDAEPPFAGLAIIPGFLNSGPEMEPWCEFYASHGIVCMMTNSLPPDIPQIRAVKLLDGVDAMKMANADPSSPLYEKMAGRYATSGYSMGGGGTTLASVEDPSLMASIGLAAWGPVGAGVSVPTMLLCGSSDTVAPCALSSGAYVGIPAATPKIQVTCSGATHFNWFSPTTCSGPLALAFVKAFVERDERYLPLVTDAPSGATINDTNL